MALVKKLVKIQKSRTSIQEPTDCSYSIVTDSKGNKYLQFDSTGSEKRKIKGKISQTLQFDRGALTQLAKILKDKFNLNL